MLWILLRIAVTVGSSGFPATSSNPLLAALLLGSLSIVVIATVLWIEMARRGELVFLANLGFSFAHTVVTVSAVCVSLEILTALVVG